MKRLLAATTLVLTCAAHAQNTLADYPCMPRQWGSTGSEYKQGAIDGYGWLGWTCQVNGEPKVFGFVWVEGFRPQSPDTAGMKTPNQVARAFLARNVIQGDNRPGFVSARIAMRQAFVP